MVLHLDEKKRYLRVSVFVFFILFFAFSFCFFASKQESLFHFFFVGRKGGGIANDMYFIFPSTFSLAFERNTDAYSMDIWVGSYFFVHLFATGSN